MENMDSLHGPLSVLARAVQFKNLTSASAHVGLSQPQLSRIVAQLEKELNVTLLDRSARRKSGWTSTALKLSAVYSENTRHLHKALATTLKQNVPKTVRLGSLEGLSFLALHLVEVFLNRGSAGDFAKQRPQLDLVELNVFDQKDLESLFANGDLDLIVTSRPPGLQKYKHVLKIGHQAFKAVATKKTPHVLSPWEYGKLKEPERTTLGPAFVSNSLALRRTWLEKFGGSGRLPARVQTAPHDPATDLPVLLIGQELFHEDLWKIVTDEAQDRLRQAILD
jgi:LysR family transcriptional regulator, transcriptional activator for aaeXAB operon